MLSINFNKFLCLVTAQPISYLRPDKSKWWEYSFNWSWASRACMEFWKEFTETLRQFFDCLCNNLISAISWPLTSYSSNTTHSLSLETQSYALSRSTKHVHTSLAYSYDFSKTCWRAKIWSMVDLSGRNPHCAPWSWDSTILPHLFSRHFA